MWTHSIGVLSYIKWLADFTDVFRRQTMVVPVEPTVPEILGSTKYTQTSVPTKYTDYITSKSQIVTREREQTKKKQIYQYKSLTSLKIAIVDLSCIISFNPKCYVIRLSCGAVIEQKYLGKCPPEDEVPKAPSGVGHEKECPLPSRLGMWGSVVISTSGVRCRVPDKNAF